MEKKIKVLIVGSDSSVKGGITSVIDSFLKYDWNGIEIELLPTYIEGSVVRRILFFLKSIFKYIDRLIKNDFDISHIHMSYKGSFFRKYLIVKLNRLFKKKAILHLHGSEFEMFYNNSNINVKRMIKSTLESVDCVIVLGENWRSVVSKITSKANIEVFNNAVNVPDFKAKWNEECINILFLGVLIKRKGIYDLIEVIRELNESGIIKEKKMNFIIGGSGIEENEIKRKIIEYNLDFCIEMTGWVNGSVKENLLKKSQIFVLPSYNEGLPMAILEAMSYGIPVISSNIGSINEAIIENKTGYMILPGDINELRNKIELICDNNILWKDMSENSRNHIINKFNEKKYFETFSNEYIKLVNTNNK